MYKNISFLVFIFFCGGFGTLTTFIRETECVDAADYEEALKDDEVISSDSGNNREASTEYPNGVNVIPGQADIHYPILSKIPKSSFSCRGRLAGFYADSELRCQVWHICDESGVQQSFLCTNGTIYSQDKRVCDWWYNVNCDPEEVSRNYEANSELYKGPPKKEGSNYNENESNELPSAPPQPPSRSQSSQSPPPQRKQQPVTQSPQEQRENRQQQQHENRRRQQEAERRDQETARRSQEEQQEQRRQESQSSRGQQETQRSGSHQQPQGRNNNEENLQRSQSSNYIAPRNLQSLNPQQHSQQRAPSGTPPPSGTPEKKRVIVLRLPGPLPPGATIPPHVLMEYAESVLAAEREGKAPPAGLVSHTQHNLRPKETPRPQQQQQQQQRPTETPRPQPHPQTQTSPPAQAQQGPPPAPRPTPRGPILPYTPRPFSQFLDDAIKFNGQTKTRPQQTPPQNYRPPPPPQEQSQRPQQRPQTPPPQPSQPQQHERQQTPPPQQRQHYQQRTEEPRRPSPHQEQNQRPREQQQRQHYQEPRPQQQRPEEPRRQQTQQPQQRPEEPRRQQTPQQQQRQEEPRRQQAPQQQQSQQRQQQLPEENEEQVQRQPQRTPPPPPPVAPKKPVTKPKPHHSVSSEPTKKFRHSTPRKHGDVNFAPKSFLSADDLATDSVDERQFPEESRRPVYSFGGNSFSVPSHLSPDVFKEQSTSTHSPPPPPPKEDIHSKQSFTFEQKPERAERIRVKRPLTSTTTTTEEPERYLSNDEIIEPAIKRLVLAAGLKIRDPRPLKVKPAATPIVGSSEEVNQRSYDPVKIIVARKTTTTTESPATPSDLEVISSSTTRSSSTTEDSTTIRVPVTRRVIKKKLRTTVPPKTTRTPTTTKTTTNIPQTIKEDHDYPEDDYQLGQHDHEVTKATRDFGFDVYGRNEDEDEDEELEKAAQEYYQASEHYGKRKRPQI